MAKYILGTSPVPDWCEKDIMPYRKLDGSTGFEYTGKVATFELVAGDVLIKDGERVTVKHTGEKKR